MSSETRDTLLHGQLQDGLRHEIMKAPAVSGAQDYKQLCLAARNEEQRLSELEKRQQYAETSSAPSRPVRPPPADLKSSGSPSPKNGKSKEPRRCYNCNKPGHLARDCRAKASESAGRPGSKGGVSSTKQVDSSPGPVEPPSTGVLELLYSSSEGESEAEM